ncbi:unnamed protein product [Clonostachys byssicola]|uniref:Rhodopsin domain-containing protein n=1 Tax=Clonostachys byssicola TaxID=160290 RepID=A0A9N9UF63_9HYPO|nr:unnamed protein product [Clonostachys byssicola]
MGMESYDDFRARLDGAAISTYILATLAVPAKLWCRTRVGGWSNIGMDDWLSIATLFWMNVFFWITMIGLRPYLGRNAGEDVPMDEVELFSKCLFAAALTYCVAIAFIKFTILAFYWKLFSVTARIPIMVIFASVAAWLITFLCLGAFGCQPIKAQWDFVAMATAKCLPQKSIYLGGSLPNVIIDFVLVLMPIPYVWGLNVPLGQRLILAGMFLLGLFVCIVSIIRLTEVMSISTSDTNITYNLKNFMLWSIVEINIGLVCSCLPSLRRLAKTLGLGALFSRGSSANKASGTPGGNTPAPTTAGGNTGNQSNGGGSRFHSMLKSRGIWSSVAGLTKLDSDEEYQMIDHQHKHAANPQGKTTTGVTGERRSRDTEDDKEHSVRTMDDQPGITVHHDWSVVVDNKPNATR